MADTPYEAHLRKARRARAKADAALGISHNMTPAAPVTAHILGLHDDGFPYQTIAAASGVSLSAIRLLIDTEPVATRGTTAHAIMALDGPAVFAGAPDDELVPTFAARRRIQALGTLGWRCLDLDALAARGGVALYSNMMVQQARTTAAKHRAVAQLFARIGDRPGPSSLTRRKSVGWGWAAPHQWEPRTIDDARGRAVWPVDLPPTAEGLPWQATYVAVVKASRAGHDTPAGARRLRITESLFDVMLSAHRLARDPAKAARCAATYTDPRYRPRANDQDMATRHAAIVHLSRSGFSERQVWWALEEGGRPSTIEEITTALDAYREARALEGVEVMRRESA